MFQDPLVHCQNMERHVRKGTYLCPAHFDQTYREPDIEVPYCRILDFIYFPHVVLPIKSLKSAESQCCNLGRPVALLQTISQAKFEEWREYEKNGWLAVEIPDPSQVGL